MDVTGGGAMFVTNPRRGRVPVSPALRRPEGNREGPGNVRTLRRREAKGMECR
jgi:hypothetical protein